MTDDEPEAVTVTGPIERTEMANKFLPEPDDWAAKTFLQYEDPRSLAALGALPGLFPEVDELEETLERFEHKYLKSKTSVGGHGFDTYAAILEEMFGSSKPDESSGKVLRQLLNPPKDE